MFKNKKRVKVITVVLIILLCGAVIGTIFFSGEELKGKQSESGNAEKEETEMKETSEVSEEEVIMKQEDVIKTMVYMENKNDHAAGNGSVYQITEDEVIIVTTYHLLKDAELISIWFYDNAYAEGNVIGVNEKHDVGFVKIPREEVPQETMERIKAIQRNDSLYDLLKQGDPVSYPFLSYDGVFVCQESRIGSIASMNWYVEEFADELIYNYCEVQPGMSGCAAIAEDGSYVGMVVGGYENESAALSIKVIDQVYGQLE